MSTLLPFNTIKGLDLTSSEQGRSEDFASRFLNAVNEGSPELPKLMKRNGDQVKGDTAGGFGLIRHVRWNPVANEEQEEMLAIGDSLQRYKEVSLEITYAGAATSVDAFLGYDTTAAQLIFRLTVDGVVALSQNLGDGYDVASPLTVTQLSTAIDAVSGFSVVVTGTGSIPAAFLDITPSHDLLDTPLTLKACEFETVGGPAGFGNVTYSQDVEGFELPGHTSLNNILYIANGPELGRLAKYDGLKAYSAGLPTHPGAIASEHTSGTLANGTYNYRFRLVKVDAVGNRIVGPYSEAYEANVVSGNALKVFLTVAASTLGSWNSGSCAADGSQTGTTINVKMASSTPHYIVPGDTITYFDTGAGDYVERTVVSVTSSTLTLNASATIANNRAISAQLFVEIWRTTDDGSVYYRVAEAPVDSVGSDYYLDSTSDADLIQNEELIEPEYEFGPPPACRYVCTYKGGLVVAGVPFNIFNRSAEFRVETEADPSDVSFGDLENIEGFPADGSFTVRVDSKLGDKIKGIKECGTSLLVYKRQSIARLVGVPQDLDISIEWLSKDLGCVAGNSIQEINENQHIFLSDLGPALQLEAQPPDPTVGVRLRKILDNSRLARTAKLRFDRCVSHVFTKKQYYILFVPAEGGTGEGEDTFDFEFPSQGDGLPAEEVTIERIFANSNSRVFVLDYERGHWYEWNQNMAGGITTFGDELWYAERRWSAFNDEVSYLIRKRTANGHATDYEDHSDPILFRVSPAWHTAGSKDIPKQFLRLSLNGKPDIVSSCSLTVKEEVNYVADSYVAETTLTMAQHATLGTVAQTRLADGKFKSIRLTFENNEHLQTPEIDSFTLEVDQAYIGELKK